MREGTRPKGTDTILIDMYGVILEESKGNFIPYTFAQFDQSEHGRLHRQFREERLFTKAGNGEFDSDTFLSLLGFQDPAFHMREYITKHLTLDEGFIPFAERMQGKYRLVLLSNDVSQWSTFITEYHDLNKYFTDKIVSGDVKCRKPDPEIYKIALERIGKAPQECIFVDNSVANLDAAEKMGIFPILFDRDKEPYEGCIVDNFTDLADRRYE